MPSGCWKLLLIFLNSLGKWADRPRTRLQPGTHLARSEAAFTWGSTIAGLWTVRPFSVHFVHGIYLEKRFENHSKFSVIPSTFTV